MIKDLIISMRPEQWYKNLVIFVGIVFSLNLWNLKMWINVIFTFIIFCILSGGGYIVNDLIDIERDRKHPQKRKRPIPSGKLTPIFALIFAIILIFTALVGSYLINIRLLIISLVYFLLVLSYSLFLKHLIIIDILVISSGFVIRAIAGCLVINVVISPWLIICAFLLALFLALCKRRYELTILSKEAVKHRKTLGKYSVKILDQMINTTVSSLILSYSLYTFHTNNIQMMITIPVVIYGLFRYLFLIQTGKNYNEVEVIFRDKGMMICIIIWILLVLMVLYL